MVSNSIFYWIEWEAIKDWLKKFFFVEIETFEFSNTENQSYSHLINWISCKFQCWTSRENRGDHGAFFIFNEISHKFHLRVRNAFYSTSTSKKSDFQSRRISKINPWTCKSNFPPMFRAEFNKINWFQFVKMNFNSGSNFTVDNNLFKIKYKSQFEI